MQKCMLCLIDKKAEKNKWMKSFDENLNFIAITDEKLGVYFKCIKGLDQKRWFARETHLRNVLNIKCLDDESYYKLSC